MSTAVLLGTTAIAAAKHDSHQTDFRDSSHRLDVPHGSYIHKEDDRHSRGRHDHHKHSGYREPDQIDAFQHFWRKTGSFALSCTRDAWNVVFHRDRFHHGKHPHKPHGGSTPPEQSKPQDGYTPPDQGKPDGNEPHIADTSNKPDWYTPEPGGPDRPIPIPEPGSLPVLGAGLLTAWLLRRRTKACRAA